MTPGHSQSEKTAASEMSALGVASLDGPMSVLPQLGDTEEKLRQVILVQMGWMWDVGAQPAHSVLSAHSGSVSGSSS